MRGAYIASFCLLSSLLASCAHQTGQNTYAENSYRPNPSIDYSARMPQTIAAHGEKVIVVDPSVHAWGAYSSDGSLVRGGLATAGNSYCPDIHRGCRTAVGSFRINSLGSFDCKSKKYPIPRGGAPMPYCMYFHGGQGLHGSYDVVDANVSHGCVRVSVSDAEWIRHDFANVGTKLVVRPY